MFTDGDIDGVIVTELKVFSDARGWLSEIFREDELTNGFDPAMGYISMTLPDFTRGPHEHKEQTDYFCFIGKFTLYLWDNRKNSTTYKNKKIIENADRMIVIVPPGIVHAYKNTGREPSLVLNFPDRLYKGFGKKEPVDEIRYEDDVNCHFEVK